LDHLDSSIDSAASPSRASVTIPTSTQARLTHVTLSRPSIAATRKRPSSVRQKTENFDPDLLKKAQQELNLKTSSGAPTPERSDELPVVEDEAAPEEQRKKRTLEKLKATGGLGGAMPMMGMLPMGGLGGVKLKSSATLPRNATPPSAAQTDFRALLKSKGKEPQP